MLTEEEKYRYSRHIKLNEVGESGQQKLKHANVLVIGA
jgi:adenylyltransferase/sulfurtransferase